MKIVIDVDEKDYDNIIENKSDWFYNGCILRKIYNSLENGTPLDNIISQIEQARDKDKIAQYPYNRCIEILRRAVDED